MDIGQQIERALRDRQAYSIGGLRRVNITRARVLDAIGTQPIVIEYLTEPYLMVDGQNVKLPHCVVNEGKPTWYRVSFDVWSAYLGIAVDYVARSVAEVEAKAVYCSEHGVRYCHIGDGKLNDVCDALASVVAERRTLRGLGLVEKSLILQPRLRLGLQQW